MLEEVVLLEATTGCSPFPFFASILNGQVKSWWRLAYRMTLSNDLDKCLKTFIIIQLVFGICTIHNALITSIRTSIFP